MKCYVPDYPRPQLVRPGSWENLNGQWDFAFDDSNEGLAKAWYSGFPPAQKITVPFSYETPKSGINDPGRHDVVWYQRSFSYKKSSERLMIHFEGCDYKTDVYINGSHAGTHRGGYARFSFDITHLVKEGENRITVRVEDSFDLTKPRGKQRWRDENFGCWYIQTTGIWKTVWLEKLPGAYIASVKMTPCTKDYRLDIEAEISVPSEASLKGLEFEALIYYKDHPVTGVAVPVTRKRLELSASVRSLSVSAWNMTLWSPEHPELYDMVFLLKRKGETVDEALSYFGMREIRIDGANILLNGVPLYQRLILDQGYWKESHLTPPDEKALIDDIDKIMAAGYNGVRKHQKTEDERFLYWADVKGLLVWSEAPATYEFCDEAVDNFTREWMEIVRQNYNHPAIITWTPFNESWGVPEIKTSRAQAEFTEAIYYLTKSYDPCRPVICNDGWEHTISDIITLHDYEEKGEDFLDRYLDNLEEILDNELYHNVFKSAFADGYSYQGQPIILSEFGGIAFESGKEGWGYGNKVATKEKYIKRFDDITTAIKKVEIISGYCYTQVSDVQQEINGIMDIERNFKVDPAVLKEINERKISNRYRLKI
ncbi:MAG: glycoside hydrolase family 2 [Treponema sp.]|jgi:beta-galactosidase/beta-glucuronidase|nr:glycoside hydrolase family 2 [Treponema sp.]